MPSEKAEGIVRISDAAEKHPASPPHGTLLRQTVLDLVFRSEFRIHEDLFLLTAA